MLKGLVFLWIVGLFTIVPYGAFYLFFEATRDEYAFWIVFVLFWIFGFWGVAGPVLSAIKVHQIFNALENAKSGAEIVNLIRKKESQDVIIEFIANENHVPRFIARKIYKAFVKRLSESKHVNK